MLAISERFRWTVGGFAVAILITAALGAGVGLLYAPLRANGFFFPATFGVGALALVLLATVGVVRPIPTVTPDLRKSDEAYRLDLLERIRVEEALRRSLEEKDVLLREVHHRVKNNLQMICSLLTLQARREDDDGIERAFREAVSRIRSIALLHERIYATNGMTQFHLGAYLEAVASAACASMGISSSACTVRTGEFRIGSVLDTVVPTGLIVTELVTNAIKHHDRPAEEIHILVRAETVPGGERVIVVEDDGPGFPWGFEEKGTLGVELVSLLAQQLRGGVTWGKSEELVGSRIEVRIPPFETVKED